MTLIVSLACVGVYKREWVKQRAMTHYWQARARAYSPAGDFVVYDSNCDRAKELIRYPEYTVLQLDSAGGTLVGFEPKAAAEIRKLIGPERGGVTLFMGERRSRSGLRRLVLIEMPAQEYIVQGVIPEIWPFQFEYTLIEPAPPFGLLRYCGTAVVESEPPAGTKPATFPSLRTFEFKPVRRVRIYAGQSDPADESHFTIRYEITPGGVGTVDGWLEGENVRFVTRDGPAAVARPRWLTTRPISM